MSNYSQILKNIFGIECKSNNPLDVCIEASQLKLKNKNITFDDLNKYYKDTYDLNVNINSINDLKNVENIIINNRREKANVLKNNINDELYELKHLYNNYNKYVKNNPLPYELHGGQGPIPTPPPPQSQPQQTQSQPQQKQPQQPQQPQKFKQQPQPTQSQPQKFKQQPQPTQSQPQKFKQQYKPQEQFNIEPIDLRPKKTFDPLTRAKIREYQSFNAQEAKEMNDLVNKGINARYKKHMIDEFHPIVNEELDILEEGVIQAHKQFESLLGNNMKKLTTSMTQFEKMNNALGYQEDVAKNALNTLDKLQPQVIYKQLTEQKKCEECLDLFDREIRQDYDLINSSDKNKKQEYYERTIAQLNLLRESLMLKYYSTGNTAYANRVDNLIKCYNILFNNDKCSKELSKIPRKTNADIEDPYN